jgi:hypothetical protein
MRTVELLKENEVTGHCTPDHLRSFSGVSGK